MKTTFIAKAIAVIVACSILALFLVPTGFAYKVGVGDSDPTAVTSCNDKLDTFTIFPYARFKTNANGSASGIEVHVSSVDGNCSTKIYSSHDVGYDTDFGLVQDNIDTAIALR